MIFPKRRCAKCGSEKTTINKKFLKSASGGERWYNYDDGEARGYRCHNCYMRDWNKKSKK